MRTAGEDNLQALKISDRVFWVGAIDWKLRDFHGYLTSEGSTYNAFLIVGDNPVLIDTVKSEFTDEMMARIRSVIDPKQIKTIISNHSELDHSGALPMVITEIEPEEIIASAMGVKALADHFHWDLQVRAAVDGERFDAGGTWLRFAETRMLHWPDSMFTYFEDEGILFSNDAFGMHLASTERFIDELPDGLTHREAAKYYANILLPYSPLITKLIAKLPELDYNLNLIAPDHGPLWRGNTDRIINNYERWARQLYYPKVVIVFDTMWGSTQRMAQAVGEGVRQIGLDAVLMPLVESHRSDVITELLEAGALVIGSPTLNGFILPSIADVTTYIKGLKPRNLVGGAFGSYGWAPQSITQVEQILNDMSVEFAGSSVKVKYVPSNSALDECRELGVLTAERLKTRISESQDGGPKK